MPVGPSDPSSTRGPYTRPSQSVSSTNKLRPPFSVLFELDIVCQSSYVPLRCLMVCNLYDLVRKNIALDAITRVIARNTQVTTIRDALCQRFLLRSFKTRILAESPLGVSPS